MNKLSKGNIAQLIVLDTAGSSSRTARGGRTAVCVVNTHLYASKNQPVEISP